MISLPWGYRLACLSLGWAWFHPASPQRLLLPPPCQPAPLPCLWSPQKLFPDSCPSASAERHGAGAEGSVGSADDRARGGASASGDSWAVGSASLAVPHPQQSRSLAVE